MKLYAPKYYKSFSCIADKCEHNCCIGWEIDVDSESLERYRALNHGYGKEIIRSLELEPTPHFRLGENERCPHLDENRLCRIITELGEEELCHICREHPRFYCFSSMRAEVGIGMACEEACRIILSSDEYDRSEELGEAQGSISPSDFDAVAHRENIYFILKKRTIAYTERLKKISELYRVSPSEIPESRLRELLLSLEYMNDVDKHTLSEHTDDLPAPAELEPALERALAYFIFRHCTDATDEIDLRATLGFSLLCERILRAISAKLGLTSQKELLPYARMLSEELEYSEENTEMLLDEFYSLL